MKINKTKILFLLVLFFFIFGFAKSSLAATYTVCSSGCTSTSIQGVFAAHATQPDDVVEVQADTPRGSKTYYETVTPGSDDSGALGHPVTLRARTGDTITIDGQNTRTNGFDLSNVSNFTLGGSSGNGFTVLNCTGSPIQALNVTTTGLTISYNTVTVNYSGGSSSTVRTGISISGQSSTPYAHMTNPIIEHNTITDESGCYSGADTDLIRMAWTTGGIIRYNNVTQNNTCGSPDNHQDGIQTWSNTDLTINNNIVSLPIDNNHQQGIYEEEYNYDSNEAPTDYGTVLVYNNLIYGYGGSYLLQALARPSGALTQPASCTIKVYNNTIDLFNGVNSPGTVLIRDFNTVFENNIILSASPSNSICYSIYNDVAGYTTTVTSNYNHIYPPAGTSQSAQVTSISTTSTQTWRSWADTQAAGYEANGIGYSSGWHSPLFVSEGSNYQLTSSSPDINRGADLSSIFTTDLLGNTRTGTWDIGAYEYSSGTSDTTPPAAPTGLNVQ